jgi:hypothetical protein
MQSLILDALSRCDALLLRQCLSVPRGTRVHIQVRLRGKVRYRGMEVTQGMDRVIACTERPGTRRGIPSTFHVEHPTTITNPALHRIFRSPQHLRIASSPN